MLWVSPATYLTLLRYGKVPDGSVLLNIQNSWTRRIWKRRWTGSGNVVPCSGSLHSTKLSNISMCLIGPKNDSLYFSANYCGLSPVIIIIYYDLVVRIFLQRPQQVARVDIDRERETLYLIFTDFKCTKDIKPTNDGEGAGGDEGAVKEAMSRMKRWKQSHQTWKLKESPWKSMPEFNNLHKLQSYHPVLVSDRFWL